MIKIVLYPTKVWMVYQRFIMCLNFPVINYFVLKNSKVILNEKFILKNDVLQAS